MALLTLTAGLVLLVVGAEALVRGASRLAANVGLPPLVIGLTVVAFGTSSPELVVSVQSALSGQSEIALGNVVGSNVFNVLFILGLSALVTPLAVQNRLIRRDVPWMVAVSIVLTIMAVNGSIGRLEGTLLMFGLIGYTAALIVQRRRASALPDLDAMAVESTSPSPLVNAVLTLGGLGLLIWGSRWLVGSAVTLAQSLEVSELIIGLTIVAGGTSLPEVATSVLASVRGERDIAVGNVVGSNLFNILGVLGVSSAVAPLGLAVPATAVTFDLPVMLAAALVCLPIFWSGQTISRAEGGLFLSGYVAYTALLIVTAPQGPMGTETVMFLGPFLGLVVLTLLWQSRSTRGINR